VSCSSVVFNSFTGDSAADVLQASAHPEPSARSFYHTCRRIAKGWEANMVWVKSIDLSFSF
jgi:hypothetical protein